MAADAYDKKGFTPSQRFWRARNHRASNYSGNGHLTEVGVSGHVMGLDTARFRVGEGSATADHGVSVR